MFRQERRNYTEGKVIHQFERAQRPFSEFLDKDVCIYHLADIILAISVKTLACARFGVPEQVAYCSVKRIAS
jgi:hypothetical protein